MSRSLPAGPYKQVSLGEGRTAPWYIIPFDKHGTCTGPRTRDHLVRAVGEEGCTDVFLFSHGWNNDWSVASQRYEEFIGGLIKTRATFGVPYPASYKPVLAGVLWPSTALVLPWERAPEFASASVGNLEVEIGGYQSELAEFADLLPSAKREQFYRLAQAEALVGAEATEFATLLGQAIGSFDLADEDLGVPDGAEPSPAERVAAWAGWGARPEVPGEFGYVTDDVAEPTAAGIGDLDPRGALRAVTVLQMKDRATRVGTAGVAPLLHDLLRAAPDVRVHLVGHSYGCIVVLSALCASSGADAPPEAESVLLLQPAVSQWCFAEDVAGLGYPGGYREALRRVRKPIFTTFSRADTPLRQLFHLAARRARDLGQPQIAGADLPEAPSRYAALGGYGPAGLRKDEYEVLPLGTPPERYRIRPDPVPRVCALNGDRGIGGHGDISNPMTWWAMLTLMEPVHVQG